MAAEQPTAESSSGDRLTAHVLPAPGWVRAHRSLLLPAPWVLVGLLLVCGWRLATILAPVVTAYPRATAATVVLFGLYAVPFVLVVRGFDFLEQEPPLLLATAFAWGGLVATTVAAAGGSAAHDLLAKEYSPRLASEWGAALVAPTLEEPVKLLGVVMIVLVAGHQLNSVVDGFVYGAFVGLGFQVVDDAVYALAQVSRDGQDSVGPVVVQFLLRGFIGGLWSHTAFTAVAGAGLGYLVVRRERPWDARIGVAGLALAAAWGVHFLWNSPWLVEGFGAGTWGVLGALVLKGLPAVLLVLVLARVAGRQEAGHYLDLLAAEDDDVVCTVRERAALASLWGRRSARRYALDRYGRRAAREVRYLQEAQARLAVELSRGGPDVERFRARARECRTHLRRLGHPEAYAPPGSVPPWWLVFGVLFAIGGLCLLFVLLVTRLGGA